MCKTISAAAYGSRIGARCARLSGTTWIELSFHKAPVIARLDRRSSIPETAVVEPTCRGVLDAPHARGMTTVCGAATMHYGDARRSLPRCATLHTRPRVQRAPGIPCSLSDEGQIDRTNLGSIMPRECGCTSPSAVMPRFLRGNQYAAASRLKHRRLWNTGTPVPATPRRRRGSAVVARRSFSEGGEPATTNGKG